MPVVDTDEGTVIPRFANEQLDALIAEAETVFGKGVRNKANSIRQLIELFGVLGFSDLEQDFLDIISQMDPRTATGQFLEGHLWPIFEPEPAKLAAGAVHVNYLSIPTAPDPFFSIGDLDFIDGVGNRFAMASDVGLPDKLFDSNETATNSESIGSANTKISQMFTLSQEEFVQMVRLKVSTVPAGTPVGSLRIETDDGTGKPSGTLAHDNLVKNNVTLAVGNVDFIITQGALIGLDGGTFHVVITVTGGQATFDGGAGGTANSVKVFTGGAWVNSTLVENLFAEVYEGGVFSVQSSEFGEEFNIEAEAIGDVVANNPTASSRFTTYGGLFTNLDAFTGGRLAEDSPELRSRAQSGRGGRENASTDGITRFFEVFVDGVESADVVENVEMEWLVDDVATFDQGGVSGSNSTTLDATTTRLAQKIVLASPGQIAAVAIDWQAMTALDFDLRLETDSAGDPSGTLVSSRTELTGLTPAGTGREVYTFAYPQGDVLDPGTYWLVMTRNSGSAVIDGEATSGDDAAKKFAGTWTLDTPDNYAIELFGGMPPKSIRAFVDGGVADDIAAAIGQLRAGGMDAIGTSSGTRKNAQGIDVVENFQRSTRVPVVIFAEINVDGTFAGDDDTIRNILTEYVGGEDVDGESHRGLGISKNLVYQLAKSQLAPRIVDSDPRTAGVTDILTFRMARKADVPTPAGLTGSHEISLAAARGERFIIEDVATDIDVTVNLT